MGRMSGKVVLITGTASGMGLAAIRLFCKEGAKVVAGYNQTPIPEEVFEEAQDEEGEIISTRLTVWNEENWVKAVNLTVERYGKIDVLINNAGSAITDANLLDATIEEWKTDLDTNLVGPALGIKHVVPVMQKNGGGSIINTSSSAAFKAEKEVPPTYSTAKAGLAALTRAAASDFAKDNIRVNTVIPGAIYTCRVQDKGITLEEMQQQYADKAPLPPHAGGPEEIAKAYLYLASDDSKFVTGTELVVDGGMSL